MDEQCVEVQVDVLEYDEEREEYLVADGIDIHWIPRDKIINDDEIIVGETATLILPEEFAEEIWPPENLTS